MFAVVVSAILLCSANAFSVSRATVRRASPMMMADIVDTAVGAGSFKTLAAALGAANLVSTLKGKGPFTVFAPTDEAFAKLPAGTVEALLKDIPKLSGILTYHVVSGAVKAETVVKMNGKKVPTVNGAEVTITVGADGVKVDNAKVVTTDIICDNGVIHVIDSVILPGPKVVPFNPKDQAGVSGPFGFFDPLDLCPQDKFSFAKYRESELKHGRVAMLAVLGVAVAEAGFTFLGSDISGPAIYQYQQADLVLNAWTPNVIGLTLAVEGYNIVKGWQSPDETSADSVAIAGLKDGYINGDLSFDPLGLKPKNAKDFKVIQTKEINNGRLAMLAIAGIVAQELVTGAPIFNVL